MIKYLRSTTSGAAGNGQGNTAKYLRSTMSGAAGNGMGATAKYLRRKTGGSAGSGLAPRSSIFAAPRASAWVPRSLPRPGI